MQLLSLTVDVLYFGIVPKPNKNQAQYKKQQNGNEPESQFRRREFIHGIGNEQYNAQSIFSFTQFLGVTKVWQERDKK